MTNSKQAQKEKNSSNIHSIGALLRYSSLGTLFNLSKTPPDRQENLSNMVK
jgi:hypothetical protein